MKIYNVVESRLLNLNNFYIEKIFITNTNHDISVYLNLHLRIVATAISSKTVDKIPRLVPKNSKKKSCHFIQLK